MPKPKPPATRIVRARSFVSAHPWISWSSAASIVAIIGALAGGVLWIVDHLETKGDAAIHAQRDGQKDAWQAYAISDLRKLILQKWVAECTAKRAKTDDCNTATSQLEDAKQRAADFYKAALDAGKEH